MSVHDEIRKHFLEACNIQEPVPLLDLVDLQKTEWSVDFERLMRNRLTMGAVRYGRLGAAGKPQYDRVASIEKRLAAYVATENTEYLVDIANLCLCEFVEGAHPLKHFASIDDGEHVWQKET